MGWPEQKLSDDEDLVREHLADGHEYVGGTSSVEAPCCGRRCAADMVCDVPGEGWSCDACRARLRRDDSTPWTKPRLMRAMGAPPEEVRLEEVKRLARRAFVEQKLREAAKSRDPEAGEEVPVSRREFVEAVDEGLPPASEGYPPGTEPPEGG